MPSRRHLQSHRPVTKSLSLSLTPKVSEQLESDYRFDLPIMMIEFLIHLDIEGKLELADKTETKDKHTFHISTELHKRFKAHCTELEVTMSKRLESLVNQYYDNQLKFGKE